MLAWLSKQNTLEGGTINFQADNEWGISITTITCKKKNQLISWKSQKAFLSSFYNELIIMYFTICRVMRKYVWMIETALNSCDNGLTYLL